MSVSPLGDVVMSEADGYIDENEFMEAVGRLPFLSVPDAVVSCGSISAAPAAAAPVKPAGLDFLGDEDLRIPMELSFDLDDALAEDIEMSFALQEQADACSPGAMSPPPLDAGVPLPAALAALVGATAEQQQQRRRQVLQEQQWCGAAVVVPPRAPAASVVVPAARRADGGAPSSSGGGARRQCDLCGVSITSSNWSGHTRSSGHQTMLRRAALWSGSLPSVAPAV